MWKCVFETLLVCARFSLCAHFLVASEGKWLLMFVPLLVGSIGQTSMASVLGQVRKSMFDGASQMPNNGGVPPTLEENDAWPTNSSTTTPRTPHSAQADSSHQSSLSTTSRTRPLTPDPAEQRPLAALLPPPPRLCATSTLSPRSLWANAHRHDSPPWTWHHSQTAGTARRCDKQELRRREDGP